MTITMPYLQGEQVELTTDHAASSHGIPVLVVNGEAYGPHDSVPIGKGSVKATTVVTAGTRGWVDCQLTPDELETCRAWVRSGGVSADF